MSRAIHLSMEEGEVIARCLKEKVGVSAIERLPAGGVRLVCMSADGADAIRKKLKAHVIAGAVTRQRLRPASPLW
jgi:hypothetical protein